jgi:hypothetical protein
MKNSKANYSGECLCGGIRFEVVNFEEQIGHCHCKMCQKFHGAAFSTFGETKLENIYWLRGYENLKAFHAPNGTIRQFCNTCGSSLLFPSSSNQESGTIEVALSSLDNASDLIPDAHLYTNYKVPWLDIEDNLPKYKEYRDEKK